MVVKFVNNYGNNLKVAIALKCHHLNKPFSVLILGSCCLIDYCAGWGRATLLHSQDWKFWSIFFYVLDLYYCLKTEEIIKNNHHKIIKTLFFLNMWQFIWIIMYLVLWIDPIYIQVISSSLNSINWWRGNQYFENHNEKEVYMVS